MTSYLISSPARLAPCPRCGTPTVIAIAGGCLVRVNPEPLSTAQEIAALLSGRLTYDVLVHGLPKRLYLEHRNITRIKSQRGHPVAASHECNVPALPAEGTEIIISSGYVLPDIPPF